MSTAPAWECQRSVDVDVLFHWRFDAVSDRTIRVTQRVELRGENAAAYVAEGSAGFEPNLEPGPRRMAPRMLQAAQQ